MKTEIYSVGTHKGDDTTITELALNQAGNMTTAEGIPLILLAPQAADVIDIIASSRAEVVLTLSQDASASQAGEVRINALDNGNVVPFGSVGAIGGPSIGAALLSLEVVESEGPVAPYYKPTFIGYVDMIDGRTNFQ